MSSDNSHYVQWFRHSSPYINAHRNKTFVVMLQGDAIAHPNFNNIVQDLALLNSLGVKLVLVHGARPQIDRALDTLNIQSQFHTIKQSQAQRKLRITDDRALNAVKAAIGITKADIEAKLSIALPNTPMQGSSISLISGNFVTAKPLGVIDGMDFQHTGEVRKIDCHGIQQQLLQNNMVLISCAGYSPSGEIFNLAVEDVATQTAISLQADKLIIFSELDGLQDTDGQLISQINSRELKQLLTDNFSSPAYAAYQAIKQGVERSHILSFKADGALLEELFTRDGSGTLVSQADFEQLRQASIDDVAAILQLLQPLEEGGVLVRRSREVLETEIERFYIIERDGMTIACAALYPYNSEQQTLAEIACVAVHPDYRGGGRADKLLTQLTTIAEQQNIEKVFVLTTRTAHWFIERGFIEGQLKDLPNEKKDLYNFQRNSKIFIKQLP